MRPCRVRQWHPGDRYRQQYIPAVFLLCRGSYTSVGIRAATFLGLLTSAVSFIVGLVYLVIKLLFWNRFAAGTAPMLIGVFFLGAIQIFFIGMLGEYILSISIRLMKKPYAIEEERINFTDKEQEMDDKVDL